MRRVVSGPHEIEGRRQRLVLDADDCRGVRGQTGIGGNDRYHGLAHKPDEAVGERGLPVGLHEHGRHDGRRQRATKLGKVGEAERADHPRESTGLIDVDPLDRRVRVGTAHDDHGQRGPDRYVADVSSLTNKETSVLATQDGLSDDVEWPHAEIADFGLQGAIPALS